MKYFLRQRYIIILGIILVSGSMTAHAREACIDWKKVLAHTELQSLPAGKIIAVSSFTNQTKQKSDEWLGMGLRHLLLSFLRTSEDLRVVPGSTAMATLAGTPNAIIGGSFQHVPQRLRIFIAVNDNQGNLLQQLALDVPYPNHRDLFLQLATASEEIFKLFDVSFNRRAFERVRDATTSTTCYEQYSKGYERMQTFESREMEAAAVWLNEAKQSDAASPLGYQGLVDLYGLQGLMHKLAGKPFAPFYRSAGDELIALTLLAKPLPAVPSLEKPKPVKKTRNQVSLTNRYLQGHASFLEGMHALQTGNVLAAKAAFEATVQVVPEDAIAWRELAKLYERLHELRKSTDAKDRALAINPCLEL